MWKHSAWLLLVPVLLVLAYVLSFSREAGQAAAAPPLNIDAFLDEKLPDAPKDEVKLKVDNDACYVCHGNFKEEPFVIWHGKEEIGCMDCHGKSYAHRNDEDGITPPEKMYARQDIDKCCEECHEEHDVSAVKVITRWQERCAAKKNLKDVACTDCHGQHQLKLRTVRWDKKTGKVIFFKSVPDPKKPAKGKKPDGKKK